MNLKLTLGIIYSNFESFFFGKLHQNFGSFQVEICKVLIKLMIPNVVWFSSKALSSKFRTKAQFLETETFLNDVEGLEICVLELFIFDV